MHFIFGAGSEDCGFELALGFEVPLVAEGAEGGYTFVRRVEAVGNVGSTKTETATANVTTVNAWMFLYTGILPYCIS